MGWPSIILLAAITAPFTIGLARDAKANDPPRISGPAIHDNLAVYFVHGRSAPGPTPLTLKEAMEAGRIVVHETGSVNSLAIENTGTDDVFVQAGDIVKGGQQDRVLTVSFLVPPKSGRLSIGAYCVEQGRWSARGAEDVKKFASSEKSLPSREAKLAILAPAKPPAAAPVPTPSISAGASPDLAQRNNLGIAAGRTARDPNDSGSRQSEMWQSVARAQSKLSANVGANVAAPASASSLQLSLENAKLAEARNAYVAALKPKGESAEDIVGYVVAVAGKVVGGDVYSSNALFRKMWVKQLDAAATEAIAEKNGSTAAVPGIEAIAAFLARAEAGKTSQSGIAGTTQIRETRDADQALLAETRQSAGGFIHRAYLAR